MNRIFFVLIPVFVIADNLFAQDKFINVVPQPKVVHFTEENFEIKNQILELGFYGSINEQINIAIEDLKQTAQQFCKTNITTIESPEGKILIGIALDNEQFHKILNRNNLQIEDFMGEEGYKLLIDSKNIIIAANHYKGLFYGVQTLKQMMRNIGDYHYLPGVVINDWPSFKYRSVLDDISRGPIPTMDYMKYQVRRFAEMKINTFIHYVEHVVKTKSHPEFAPADGSLTIGEWKEIADYAELYNVTIIGGFQSFGHFQNILKTPEYAPLGECGSLISPVLPESYEFLEDIYDEMIPAFKSDIFSVNCDETFDLGKEASKKMVDSIGYASVYYQHMMKLYNIVKKHGKGMLMWGDIVMKHPKLLDMLPKDILIGTWDYDARETFLNYIDPFKNAGFEFWVAPGVLNSRKIFPDLDKTIKNIRVFVKEGAAAGATGVINCIWDDGGTGLFSNDWYGVAYGADKSWNPESNDDNYDIRLSAGVYGSHNLNFTKAIWKIEELSHLELTDGMTDKFMSTKLLPDKGKHLKVSVTDLAEVLSIIDEADSLLQNAHLVNYSTDAKYLSFITELYRTLAQERFDLLDAASFYTEAENVNNVNHTTARNKIVKSLELITKIIDGQRKVKSIFEILWLKENHIYGLDWVADKYDEKINDFSSVRNGLFESLRKFDSSQPILSKEVVGLSVTKLPGKYFTEWMMPNPIIKKDVNSISQIDYLSGMGGEAAAEPEVTQEFYFDGEKYRWRRVVSEYPDIIDLTKIFSGENQNKVVYAFANVFSGKETSVTATVGSDEGIEVFINGEKVYQNKSSNKFAVDEFTFSLPLQKGKNNLMLKSSQTSGEWLFSFRLPENIVRNSKNRYNIVE